MGARLALEALLYHKAPFLSLTCLSTTLQVKDSKKQQAREHYWIQLLEKSSIEEFIDIWYTQKLFTEFIPPKRRYQQNKEAILKVLKDYSITKMPPLIDKIFTCTTPIQFIYKKNDPKSEVIKDYKHLHFTSGNSHCIHLQNPEQISSMIQAFWRKGIKLLASRTY